MIKLHNDVNFFTPLEDGNTNLYPPTLAYIFHYILSPFNLSLDIVWIRSLNIVIYFLSAILASFCCLEIFEEKFNLRRLNKSFWGVTGFLFFILVLARGVMFEIPHPDVLHIFHITLIFTLMILSIKKNSIFLMALTVLCASFGFFLKQNEILAPLSIILFLWIAKFQTPRERWALTLFGTILPITIIIFFFKHNPLSYTFLVDALSNHPLRYIRLFYLKNGIFEHSLGVFVILTTALLFFRKEIFRCIKYRNFYFKAWLSFFMVFVFCVAPSFIAYIKASANDNHITPIVFWLSIPVFLFFIYFIEEVKYEKSWVVFLMFIFTFLTLSPRKIVPSKELLANMEFLEEDIKKEYRLGKKIYMDYNIPIFIRATKGKTVYKHQPCLYSEYYLGSKKKMKPWKELKNGEYDKIYLFMEGCLKVVEGYEKILETFYKEPKYILLNKSKKTLRFKNGFYKFLSEVRVYEKKEHL